MPDPDGWTLAAWIEHQKAIRQADRTLVEMHWELDREREQHQRELADFGGVGYKVLRIPN